MWISVEAVLHVQEASRDHTTHTFTALGDAVRRGTSGAPVSVGESPEEVVCTVALEAPWAEAFLNAPPADGGKPNSLRALPLTQPLRGSPGCPEESEEERRTSLECSLECPPAWSLREAVLLDS